MTTNALVPKAGQLLGAVSSALQLNDLAHERAAKILTSRQGRRFFKEGSPGGRRDCCHVGAFTLGLMNGSLFPVPLDGHGGPREDALRFASGLLRRHVAVWDQAVRPKVVHRSQARGLVRVAVLSMARASALLRHATAEQRPCVASYPLKRGAAIREVRRRRGWTYDEMAETLVTSRKNIENWCRGTRPNFGTMLRIAEKAADGTEDQLRLLGQLRWHYALCTLAKQLDAVFGDAFAEDLRHVFVEARDCMQTRCRDEGLPADLLLSTFLSLVLAGRDRPAIEAAAAHHGSSPAWTKEVGEALDLLGASDDFEALVSMEAMRQLLSEIPSSGRRHQFGEAQWHRRSS